MSLYRVAVLGEERRRNWPARPRLENSSAGAWSFGPSLARFRFVRHDETTTILSGSFGAVAEEYNRLRPGPAPAALDWLLPEGATDVLEIGAGTGILTRLLAQRLEHVTALEPDDRMRTVLTSNDAGIEIVAGRAEEIPKASSSFDVVIAASAWHWVDEERGVPEAARVLRPAGRLSLVWSGPDRSVDWMRSLWAGGIVFSPEEQAAVDEGRRRRHVVNVGVDDGSPLPRARDRPLPLDQAHDQGGPRGLVHHLQLGYHYGGCGPPTTSRSHDALLDTVEDFAGLDVLDVPMRSYCWRATKR